MSAGHQQLNALGIQQRIGYVHTVRHGNDVRMLTQATRDLIRGGPRVEDNTMPRFYQLNRRFSNTSFNRGIQRTFILNRRLISRLAAVTDQRSAVGTHRNPLLFKERQVVTDSDGRYAKVSGKIVNLYASLLAQALNNEFTPFTGACDALFCGRIRAAHNESLNPIFRFISIVLLTPFF